MEEESEFKVFVKNESDKDRIIRVVIAILLIGFYLALPSNINALIGNIGLVVAAVLLFNAASGTCMIYQALGINTCSIPDSE